MQNTALQTFQSDAAFEQNLAFGRIGESLLATWLRRKHQWSLLPAYEIEMVKGKGPRIFTPTDQLVSPDFLGLRGNEVRWFEAKHKSVFSWYRAKQCWVTGINLRHCQQYVEVSKRFPFPIFLIFLHEEDHLRPEDPKYSDPKYSEDKKHYPCPTGLFYCRLTERTLTDASSYSHIWEKGSMIYLSINQLVQLATMEEVKQISKVSLN